jgi:hypothetical protein
MLLLLAYLLAALPGPSGLATIVHAAPSHIRSHNFNDGTLGPYINPWETGVDFPNDPTRSGHGKVARILYNPTQDTHQTSQDRGFGFNSRPPIRYGETIWMRGQVYLPYAGSSTKANHNRKLIDFVGTGPRGIHTRMTLHRRDMVLQISVADWMGGSFRETLSESTGIRLADNTWFTIEVGMTTNSADNVRDGMLKIYINGALTPSYSRRRGLGWITEKYPGGSFFSWFAIGSQLTIDAGDPMYREYRYWDNVAFSTTRIGR